MTTPSPETFDYPLFSVDHAGRWIDVTQPRLLLNLPEPREFVPNVSVAAHPAPRAKLAPLVAGAVHQLERDTTMVELAIEPVEDLEVAGVAAKWVRFAFSVPLPSRDGELHAPPSPRMCCVQVHLVRAGFAFLVTFTAAASDFEAAEPQFRELLASLRFRVPG